MNEHIVVTDFVFTHPDAKMPTKAHPDPLTGDTGYDLFAVEDRTVSFGAPVVVPIGLKLANITPGYWFRIEPRSGHGFKYHAQPHLGIIDNPYRGDLGVKIYLLAPGIKEFKKGEAVAQIVYYEIISSFMRRVDDVTETERGEGGFGSTGR